MKKALLPLFAFLILGNTSVFGQCAANEIEVTIELNTDNFGYETSWTLTDTNGDTILLGGQGGVYANVASYSESACVVDNECLRFDIDDSFGDGICCGQGNGSYTILVDGVQEGTGGNFSDVDFLMFNCPPGSSCDDSFSITEGTYTAAATNTWYSFTPTQNGTYQIEACGNSCNTKIWVYDYCDGLFPAEDNTGTIYYDNDQGGCGPQAMISGALLEVRN